MVSQCLESGRIYWFNSFSEILLFISSESSENFFRPDLDFRFVRYACGSILSRLWSDYTGCRHQHLSGSVWTLLSDSDYLHFRDRRDAASLRYKIAPKSPFLCVNRSAIQYGFRAGTKALQNSINTYPICDSPLERSVRCSFSPLQKSHRNHRSYVWT